MMSVVSATSVVDFSSYVTACVLCLYLSTHTYTKDTKDIYTPIVRARGKKSAHRLPALSQPPQINRRAASEAGDLLDVLAADRQTGSTELLVDRLRAVLGKPETNSP